MKTNAVLGPLLLAASLHATRASAQDDAPAPKPADAKPADAKPADAKAPAPKLPVHIEPFLAISTGLKVDTIIPAPTEQREGRISAIALSDFGLRGKVGDLVTFVSELM